MTNENERAGAIHKPLDVTDSFLQPVITSRNENI